MQKSVVRCIEKRARFILDYDSEWDSDEVLSASSNDCLETPRDYDQLDSDCDSTRSDGSSILFLQQSPEPSENIDEQELREF